MDLAHILTFQWPCIKFDNMNKTLLTILISVFVSGLAAYCVVKSIAPTGTASEAISYKSDGQMVKTVNLSVSDYPDFTYAAEHAVEAVVFVKVTIQEQQRQSYIDPFFRYFFGDEGTNQPRNRERQGSGSGVIIRSDGYIVTNNHVVANATKVEVRLNDNQIYEAKVVGADPATDVALLKIDAKNLPAIPIADSDKLRLGEWVLAIGSPLGEELRSTITAGIVSAKGRSMPNYDGEFKIESFIQTDAAVNPGNSGGALVNKAGELVGINTAIISTTGSYTGYSFAVPTNIVSKVVADIIDFGSVKRVKLGVSMSAIDAKLKEEMKLSTLDGVYIHEVLKGSSAEKAGIKQGDVIIALDSTPIKTPSELQVKVNSYHPGDKAEITILRAGKQQKLSVNFIEDVDVSESVADDGTISFYGATLKAVERGVEIVSVGNGKLAKAGGMDGFIILYVNDQKVSKAQDVIDIAKKSKRSIFIEGLTASGRPGYFGFGKDE